VSLVFEAEATPTVPVNGIDKQFPVHRIYCVGKNYAAHVAEMGSDPQRDPPCFFLKPADAVTTSGKIPYPPGTSNYHYETELVLAIGKGGRQIPVETAEEHIFGYAVGFDMTRRDLQMRSGGLGHPWDTGKGFDHSAPISAISTAEQTGLLDHGRICLEVNGEIRQDADINQLIWKCSEIIAELSKLYLLKPGDLIFTGTPAGVGAVVPGDRLDAYVENVGSISIEITESE